MSNGNYSGKNNNNNISALFDNKNIARLPDAQPMTKGNSIKTESIENSAHLTTPFSLLPGQPMSALYPTASTFSLPGPGFFSPQQQQQQLQQQQLLLQQRQQLQQQQQTSVNGHGAGSLPMINTTGGVNLAAARQLQTQSWLQNTNFYDLYNSSQSRAPSAISGASGRSSVSGIHDDVSSQMSAWNTSLSSLYVTGKTPMNAASIENLDPNRKNVDLAEIQSLCDFTYDNDQKLLEKWSSTINSIVSMQLMKDNHVLQLSRRIVTQLSESNSSIMNEQIYRNLLQCFMRLARTSAFKRVEAEFAYPIYAMYSNLMQRRVSHVVHVLRVLDNAFVNSPETLRKAASDNHFVTHIIRVLDTDRREHILRSALSIVRRFLRVDANFEPNIDYLVKTLIKLIDIEKIRLSAFDTVYCMNKKQPRLARHFASFDGIAIIFHCAVFENFRDEKRLNLEYAKRALTILSDLSSEKSIGDASMRLGTVVKEMIQFLYFLQQRLGSQARNSEKTDLLTVNELAFGFIRNVLARNVDTLIYVSTDKELFGGIAKIMREAIQYLAHRRGEQQQQPQGRQQQRWENAKRLQESYDTMMQSIFEDTLTALTGLNKACNPQREAASQLIDESAELNVLVQFLAETEHDNLIPYCRFIRCWHCMLECYRLPMQPSVAACLLRFIRLWNKQNQTGMRSLEKDGLMLQWAFELLAKVVEGLEQFEFITNVFKSEVNLFALLREAQQDECVAILTLIDVISSKDYSLQFAWANLDTSIINQCAESMNAQIQTLSKQIKCNIKLEEYSMTDVIMNFGS